jgi:hypothetical protein
MKQPADPEPYNEWEIELAKRLLCSTISVQMGITYQHCWKTYIEDAVKENGVAPIYLECARCIREDLFKSRKGLFSGSVS